MELCVTYMKLGIRERFPKFIENFLSGRGFHVRVGTTLSDVFNQEHGIPRETFYPSPLLSLKIIALLILSSHALTLLCLWIISTFPFATGENL